MTCMVELSTSTSSIAGQAETTRLGVSGRCSWRADGRAGVVIPRTYVLRDGRFPDESAVPR